MAILKLTVVEVFVTPGVESVAAISATSVSATSVAALTVTAAASALAEEISAQSKCDQKAEQGR